MVQLAVLAVCSALVVQEIVFLIGEVGFGLTVHCVYLPLWLLIYAQCRVFPCRLQVIVAVFHRFAT